MMNKWRFVLVFLALTISGSAFANGMIVYKTPTCGCCGKWMQHLQDNGFKPAFIHQEDLTDIKNELGVPAQLRSCHTGVVVHSHGRYLFEGHIPASIIQRFLDNPPDNAMGLIVPGMPLGSPGMEVGDRKDYYEVLLLLNDGTTQVYEAVNG